MSSLPENITNLQFLVTDDYESMRIMIAEHLQQLGIKRILFAKSGMEAVEVINAQYGTPNQIDFILTDLVMENGTGLDLVKAIRGNNSLKKLPILMVTSKAEISLVLECVKAGVSQYIVKPWQIEDLAKKIVDSLAKVK